MEIRVESLGGEYMEEATVIELPVEEGSSVRAGDVLVILETAKAQTEVTAPVDGTVSRLHVSVDDDVEVGALLVELSTG